MGTNTHKKTTATLVIAAGGSSQPLVPYLDLLDTDHVIYIDTKTEVEKVPDLPNLTKFTIADGKTALALKDRINKDHSHKFHNAFGFVSPTAFDTGLGQIPTVGAAMFESRRFEFGQKLQQLRPALLKATNGSIQKIRLVGIGSLSGGTGSGSLLPAVQAAEEYLSKTFDVIVYTDLYVIGQLTYASVNAALSQTEANHAFGIVRAAHFVLDPEAPAQVIRQLHGIELPMETGNNTDLRRDQVRRIFQGLGDQEYAKILALPSANMQAASPFGRFKTFKSWIWEQHNTHAVTASAAFHYALQLRKLIAEEPTVVARDVTIQTSKSKVHSSHHSTITRRASERFDTWDPNMIYASWDITVDGIILDDGEDVGSYVSLRSPRSLAGFESKRTDLMATLAGVRRLLETLTQEKRSKKSDHAALRQNLDDNMNALCTPSAGAAVVGVFKRLAKTSETRLREIKAILPKLEAVHDELAELKIKIEALQKLETQLEVALEDYTGRIEALARRLQRMGDEAVANLVEVDQNNFTFRDLADMFPTFMTAYQKAKTDDLTVAMRDSVAQVTFEAICKTAGLDSVEPEALIHRVLDELGTASFEAPYWGGILVDESPLHRIIVIPKTSDEVLERIREAAAAHDAAVQVMMTSSLVGGVNVGLHHTYSAKTLDHIVSPSDRHCISQNLGLAQTHKSQIPGTPSLKQLDELVAAMSKGGQS